MLQCFRQAPQQPPETFLCPARNSVLVSQLQVAISFEDSLLFDYMAAAEFINPFNAYAARRTKCSAAILFFGRRWQ
jgi:hypothetical protein